MLIHGKPKDTQRSCITPSIYKTLLALVLQKSSIYCASAHHATTFPHQDVTNPEAQQKITTRRSNVTAFQTGPPSNQAVWILGFPLLPTATLINYSITPSWDVSLWVLVPLVNQNIQFNSRCFWMLLVPLGLRERFQQTSELRDGRTVCMCMCVYVYVYVCVCVSLSVSCRLSNSCTDR